MRSSFAFLILFAFFTQGCGSNNNNSPKPLNPSSGPSPSPAASPSPGPSASPSPVGFQFRSLEMQVDCGAVTPGSCTPTDYVLQDDGSYVESHSGHSGTISASDLQNIRDHYNTYWDSNGQDNYVCTPPPQPVSGGHFEQLSAVPANATVPIYTQQQDGTICAKGDVAQARSFEQFVRTTLGTYH
jgi:hypothetical protein